MVYFNVISTGEYIGAYEDEKRNEEEVSRIAADEATDISLAFDQQYCFGIGKQNSLARVGKSNSNIINHIIYGKL